jgi:FtsH-binding integral membrane protein
MNTASFAANPLAPSAEIRERRFFRHMAVLVALTVIAGFGGWFLKGNSTFASPWWVHVHAISNMSWVALFVAQTSFIARGDHARHRALGKVGILLAAWMLLVGLVLTPYDIAVHRFPAAYFPPAVFLALDWMNITVFAALVLGGWVKRQQSDWHRRLMLAATVIVIIPAWGRLLLIAGLPGQLSALFSFLYMAIAMIADRRLRGRIHPAWYVGIAALVVMMLGSGLLANFPPLNNYANALNAG